MSSACSGHARPVLRSIASRDGAVLDQPYRRGLDQPMRVSFIAARDLELHGLVRQTTGGEASGERERSSFARAHGVEQARTPREIVQGLPCQVGPPHLAI